MIEFSDGVEHGDNILRWDVREGVVDLLEDETAAGSENSELFKDVPAHLLRRGEW